VDDQFSLVGGWVIYYPRRFGLLAKTRVTWPLGWLYLEGERITLTARGSLGRIFSTIAPKHFPVTIPLSQITKVERLHWRRKLGPSGFAPPMSNLTARHSLRSSRASPGSSSDCGSSG
jgi:hypothetical protein